MNIFPPKTWNNDIGRIFLVIPNYENEEYWKYDENCLLFGLENIINDITIKKGLKNIEEKYNFFHNKQIYI